MVQCHVEGEHHPPPPKPPNHPISIEKIFSKIIFPNVYRMKRFFRIGGIRGWFSGWRESVRRSGAPFRNSCARTSAAPPRNQVFQTVPKKNPCWNKFVIDKHEQDL